MKTLTICLTGELKWCNKGIKYLKEENRDIE